MPGGVKRPQEPEVSPLHGVNSSYCIPCIPGPAQHWGERGATRSHIAQEGKHRDTSQKWDGGMSWRWNAWSTSEWYFHSLAFAVCRFWMFLLPVSITEKSIADRDNFELVLENLKQPTSKPNPQISQYWEAFGLFKKWIILAEKSTEAIKWSVNQ